MFVKILSQFIVSYNKNQFTDISGVTNVKKKCLSKLSTKYNTTTVFDSPILLAASLKPLISLSMSQILVFTPELPLTPSCAYTIISWIGIQP